MDSHELYAHRRDADEINAVERYQPLTEHLANTEKLAGDFGRTFGSEETCRVIGRLHDIGKSRDGFQRHIRTSVDGESCVPLSERRHSGVGACLAVRKIGLLGRIYAYCVAGHHAGLPDWSDGRSPNGSLCARLSEEMPELSEKSVADFVESPVVRGVCDGIPRMPFSPKGDGFAVSMWIRMMYSCLVDADFLDTETIMSPARASERRPGAPIEDLWQTFLSRLDEKQRSAPDTDVNRVRAEIRTACETASGECPGIFSLTVPTGGGKTLSAMAFAFQHAKTYKKRRIIYVIPYTSIIEQTSDTLRRFIGGENVLEHHSNFDPARETPASRLASENWDASVIVTTTVQFFESLYSSRPCRCRKLHNIADSVVIIDEVQLLPTSLLVPCTAAMRELSSHYGTTFVLSTATQPGLPGLDGVREIIPPSFDLYRRLKRTECEFPSDTSVRTTWEEVAGELSTLTRVLCVVNTRRDCRDLYRLMPKGTIHLSASMCGEHRSRVIARIKDELSKGGTVRVVSTQLIEAGVDIDFPIVYRAFSGLASIAQSAGRCNREGRLPVPGRVVVFMPPSPSPVGDLRDAEYAMSDMMSDGSFRPCLECPDSYPRYFGFLWSKTGNKGEEVVDLLSDNGRRCEFQFREADDKFNVIDDRTVPVVVRYGDSPVDEIEAMNGGGPSMELFRRLQRYSVTLGRDMVGRLVDSGLIEEAIPGVFVQTVKMEYSDEIGLVVPESVNS